MIGGQLHAKMNFARFLIDPFKTKREEEELREKAMEIMRFIGIEQYADRTVGKAGQGRALIGGKVEAGMEGLRACVRVLAPAEARGQRAVER